MNRGYTGTQRGPSLEINTSQQPHCGDECGLWCSGLLHPNQGEPTISSRLLEMKIHYGFNVPPPPTPEAESNGHSWHQLDVGRGGRG